MSDVVIVLAGFTWLTVCSGSFATSDDTHVKTVQVSSGAKVDGVLGDDCWKKADWRSGFRQHVDPGKPAICDTRFALICDDRFLYLAAEMSEPEPRKLVARARTRDANVYRDDCLQVFLDPNRQDGDYFCFTVNSLGTVRDTKGLLVGWNSDAQAAAHKSASAWSVEIAIPLGDLELTPEAAKQPWGVNVTRARRAGSTAELSTFAPVRGTFHQPAHFMPLRVPSPPLARYVWRISAPFERKVELVDGEPVFKAKVFLENLTGRFRFFFVQAGVQGESVRANGTPVRDGLDNGDRHEVEIRTPTAGLDESTLVVSLYDALEPKRLLARRRFRVDSAYSPITLKMAVPWYKNAIFATQPINQVKLSVHSDLPPETLAGYDLVADIRDGAKIVTGPVRIERVARDMVVAIPAAQLPVGDFRVRVALVDKAGKMVHNRTIRLRKLAPLAGEVCFDRNMACLVDGQPFLPFGWFGVNTEAMEEFAADGYNTIGAYLPTGTKLSDEEVKAYLDKAHSLGLKVICRPQPDPAMLRAGTLMTQIERGQMRALVRKWRDHPAVLAWYMCDEPEGKSQPLERRLQEYRVVDEEDPYHPAIVLNNTVNGIHKYHVAADLLMPDVYPGFLAKGGANRIERPTQAMLACRQAAGGRKPVWITPQGQIQVVDGHRGPTFRELRNQAWQGAAHDAMGFFWYREVFLKNLVHSKLGTPCVHQEMKAVSRAIRSKSLLDATRADVSSDRLSLGVKRVDDHIYVIAVSLDTSEMAVTFEVDELGDRPLLVLSEKRQITPHDGKFRDQFQPHEAHVYTTDLSLTSLPSIAEIEARIEREIQARHKAGNLAYQRTGAEVFPQHHGGQALFINDGSTVGVCWPREYGKVSHPLPNWVDIRFPEPQTIGRVVVYSARGPQQMPTFRDGEVQIFRSDSWTTVAEVTGNEKDPATFTFDPLETESLRLLITQVNGSRVAIQEIEVYAK